MILYNGIVFSYKKGKSMNIYYNMDEPWKYYAKWKKPAQKDYMLCDFNYIKYPESATS